MRSLLTPGMSEGLAQDGTPLPNLESPVLQCNAGTPPVQGIFHWHNAAGSRRVRGEPENVDSLIRTTSRWWRRAPRRRDRVRRFLRVRGAIARVRPRRGCAGEAVRRLA